MCRQLFDEGWLLVKMQKLASEELTALIATLDEKMRSFTEACGADPVTTQKGPSLKLVKTSVGIDDEGK